MKLRTVLQQSIVASAWVVMLTSHALAIGITNITFINNSSPTLLIDDPTRLREFRTESSFPVAATTIGDSATFTHRLAWMSGHRVLPGGGTVALLNSNLVAYDLSFTIEDPTSLGYTLDIDSTIRGYATAFWESNSSTGVSQTFAAGTLMGASLDSGAGFGSLITDLSTTIAIASATDTTPFANQLVSRSSSFAAGSFVGTHTFTLRYTTVGANTIGALQNFNTGEADVRFGLDPTLSGFLHAAYPGADGEAAADHGHFLTITADFNADAAVVPEPATLSLVGLGLLVFSTRIRRKKEMKADS